METQTAVPDFVYAIFVLLHFAAVAGALTGAILLSRFAMRLLLVLLYFALTLGVLLVLVYFLQPDEYRLRAIPMMAGYVLLGAGGIVLSLDPVRAYLARRRADRNAQTGRAGSGGTTRAS